MTENSSEVTLHCMKIKTNTQVTSKAIQEVIFDSLLIADSGNKIPAPPLYQGLLETVQKSIHLVRRRMGENVRQLLLVIRAEHEVCKDVDN
jgi:hypothetical protein